MEAILKPTLLDFFLALLVFLASLFFVFKFFYQLYFLNCFLLFSVRFIVNYFSCFYYIIKQKK